MVSKKNTDARANCHSVARRSSLKIVEELTGRIDTEEVLGIIFKSFCIGK